MKKIFLLMTLIFSVKLFSADVYTLTSPAKGISYRIIYNNCGKLVYSLSSGNKVLIENSELGLITDNKIIPGENWYLRNVSRTSHKGQWKPVWGKRILVNDCYNGLIMSFSATGKDSNVSKIDVEFRIYDDGASFRYILPNASLAKEEKCTENSNFCFADDYTAWFYNGENHNVGPVKLTDVDKIERPVMTIKVDENNFMALHEADLREGFSMELISKKGEKTFAVDKKDIILHPGYISPWRVIFYGKTAGVMVDSHLLELLNPDPASDMDFSWVRPGVCLWDWRINGAKTEDFTYGMNYDSWVRMVDFASQENIKHLVLDANWYGPEFKKESNPVNGDKANDVRRIIDYAKARNVGIWLYLNDVGGRKYSLEETFQQYHQWGATGVKYGFMKGNTAEKNERTRMITWLCAKNKLLVDFHDNPVHPYGQMRTCPNAVTREYCEAQLDGHKVFYPKTFVTSAFVNAIAGPLDMNNGMFDLRQGKTTRVDENKPVPSTLASEAARTLIIFSGAVVIPDIPEYYKKYPSLLRFIFSQKMPWLESKTLMGEIGEYIVTLRETDENYLIGGATNEESRVLSFPLNFLPKGKNFNMELTKDGKDAHYLNNRETIEVDNKTVTRDSKLSIKLAAGGGFCILIKKTI